MAIAVSDLDRSSAVPLYYQLQELLRQQIEDGLWAPGSPLPGELELSRTHGVSRVCVRQALGILEADNAIVRIQGRGTFVREQHLPRGVLGVLHVLVDPPLQPPTVRVLDRRIGSVGTAIAARLGVPDHEILRLTTCWSQGELAYAIGVTFLPLAVLPWVDPLIVPGANLVAGAAQPPSWEPASAETTIETTTCGQYEAELLGLPQASTLMVTMSSHHALVDGARRIVEVSRLGYRGDRVQLQFSGAPVA